MLLVIDANIVFAALLNPNGVNGKLLFSPKIELISPEFIEEELKKYFSLLVSKSKRSEGDVRIALDLLLSRIKILPTLEYEEYRKKARAICPDVNDAEYFAIALAFNCGLWSNDKELKEQGAVKVLSTGELLSNLQY